jgi:signal transduction histidine kinase
VRALRLALVPLALAVAVAAEWRSYRGGDLPLLVADGVVGCVLVTCGVIAWQRRPESRIGALMALAGFTWFAGNFWSAALYLHRGPLVHVHISYPTGRLRRRLALATVVLAYVDAIVEPFARDDALTLALAALVAAAAIEGYARASGPARRAGVPALAAALAYAGVLALGAVDRLAGWGVDRGVLGTYDAVIAALAVVLCVDLLRGRWSEAVVAGLVIDLGKRSDTRTLQDELGRALGDRSLVVGYRLPGEERYVDDAGRPVEIPEPGAGRAVTRLAEDGVPIAVLVHDEAVLADPALIDSVAAAARLALSNARLQADVRERVLELAASRRRIVEAGDAQRRRIERELRSGAERRLARVEELVATAHAHVDGPPDPLFAAVEDELRGARGELRDFAQGIRPRALADGGLAAALPELAARSAVPVRLDVAVERQTPAVEAAAYFVCSEALANVAKHAGATCASVRVQEVDGHVVLIVADDGRGGADPSGSGLRGLADRVEALGGRLAVRAAAASGTELEARIPASGHE